MFHQNEEEERRLKRLGQENELMGIEEEDDLPPLLPLKRTITSTSTQPVKKSEVDTMKEGSLENPARWWPHLLALLLQRPNPFSQKIIFLPLHPTITKLCLYYFLCFKPICVSPQENPKLFIYPKTTPQSLYSNSSLLPNDTFTPLPGDETLYRPSLIFPLINCPKIKTYHALTSMSLYLIQRSFSKKDPPSCGGSQRKNPYYYLIWKGATRNDATTVNKPQEKETWVNVDDPLSKRNKLTLV